MSCSSSTTCYALARVARSTTRQVRMFVSSCFYMLTKLMGMRHWHARRRHIAMQAGSTSVS